MRQFQKIAGVTALLLTLFLSCREKEKKPAYVWDEEKFIEVLTEFQLAESMVRLGYHRFKDSLYVNDSIYKSVFKKMGVEESKFDSNYVYYLQKPKKMEEIYEKVITRLSQRSAELEQKKSPEEGS